MVTINYYLDKSDKKGFSPIHLRIICNGQKIKLSTREKVKDLDFDKDLQRLKNSADNQLEINYYLTYLEDRTKELFNNPHKKTYTNTEIKKLLSKYISSYKQEHNVSIVREQVALYGKPFTFIDLFAGAGGFSEGFLQAEVNNKFFDFLLANDINDNSELTHLVRYNHQLGLDTKFLCQDITEPDFIDNLLKATGKVGKYDQKI